MRAKHTEQNTSTALYGTSRVGIAAESHAVALVKGFWCFEGIVRKRNLPSALSTSKSRVLVLLPDKPPVESFCGIFSSLQSRRHGPSASDKAENDGYNVKIMSTLFQPNDDYLERAYEEHKGSLKNSSAQLFKRTILRYKHSPLDSTLSQSLLRNHNGQSCLLELLFFFFNARVFSMFKHKKVSSGTPLLSLKPPKVFVVKPQVMPK